jgi:alkyl-hydroperoxide reductase/thiol specific antioxidant family protein
VQLHRVRDEIHARRAELFIIGNGAPDFAQAFREHLGIATPVYTDPSLATYRLLDFKRGVTDVLLSPKVWANAARAWRGGFRQGRVQGDPWQLGGVLVVRADETVAYRYASAAAGDHPPVADVLRALGPADVAGGPAAGPSAPRP